MVSPVRQSPVFRKAVPSVFAFPPLSIWIALSQSRRTFDYRTIRHYHIGVSDIIVSPCPIFSYRGVRYYRIALTDILVSGRADGDSRFRQIFYARTTCRRLRRHSADSHPPHPPLGSIHPVPSATTPLASLSLDKLEADSRPSQRFTASSSCPPCSIEYAGDAKIRVDKRRV